MKHSALLALMIAAPLAMPHAAQAQETEAERTDRGRIVAFIEDNLSGAGRQVILRDFQGALSSRATASQLTIADDEGIWLTINDIVLDWNRSALLTGALSVNELTAGEIILERAPVAQAAAPAPEASGFSLPELPVSVQIAKISAARVVLGESLVGQSVEGSVEAALQLSGGQGEASLRIDRTDDGPDGQIDLAASYDNATRLLSIDLSAREQAGGLAVSLLGIPGQPAADLTIRGDGPLSDFTATIGLATDGQDRLSGQIALSEPAGGGDPEFSADLRGDLAPLFLPEYRGFFGPDVALTARGTSPARGGLDLSALTLSTRSLQLDGTLRIAADGLPEKLQLRGKLADPQGGPVRLPLSSPVALQSADLAISYDSRTDDTWTAQFSGRGLDMAQAQVPSFDLTGSGRIDRRGADPLLGGTLRGSVQGMEFADARLSLALVPDLGFETRFWWQKSADVLRIAGLTASAPGLDLRLSGELSGLSTGFRLSGQATAVVADLGRFSGFAGRDLAGQGEVRLQGQGSPLGGDFDIDLRVLGQDLALGVPQADGLLAGQSSLELAVVRDPTGTELRRLALRTPALTVDGSGQLDSDQAQAALSFALSDLSRAGQGLGGALRGTASLRGPLLSGRADIEAALTAQDLRLGQPELDRLLAGAVQVDFAGALTDAALQITRAELRGQGLQAGLSGTLSPEVSDLAGRLELADLSIASPAFGGSLAVDLIARGTVEDLALTLSGRTRDVRIGQDQADRLLAGRSSIDVSLRRVAGQIRVDSAKIDNPQITADVAGQMVGGRQSLTLDARLATLALLLPDFPGPVTLRGTALEQDNGYLLDLAGTGPGQINATVKGRIDGNFTGGDLAIAGSAQAGLANPFLGTRVLSGPVALDLRLNGPFALSALSGRVTLSDGRLADATLPFSLTGLSANLGLSGGQADLSLSAGVSSGGSLQVQGGIGLAAPFAADLGITLSNVVVKDPQLFQTRANGDLRLAGPLTGGAVLSGRIALPESELRIASTGLGGAGDLPGLTHLAEPPAVRETRRRAGLLDTADQQAAAPARPYGLDLLISAPNRLFIRGRGLDAELGGELRVSGTSDNVIPSGGFQLIRGRLDILGRRLDLSQAGMQLEGSFDPYLTIVASTNADGVTANVVIEGQATDPQVSFTSSPELPQEEVIAQILFGKRLQNLSALQAVQLANAVAMLAGRGGEGIVSRLRQGFGLDDLDVQTAADGSTQVTAGKYLSENLYSEVTVDQDGKSEISLNFDLTDSVTVKGRVGTAGDTGLGIFYEKDY